MKIGIEYIGITTPFYCHDGQGNILMHKRTKECRDEHEKWDTGSGKLEFGLSVEENVLKEVKEEYGCDGTVIEQMPAHDIFRIQNGINTHWIAIPFIIKVNPEDVKNCEPNKIQELGWFKLTNLPTPLHSGFEYTLNRYRSIFEKYFS